MLEKEPTHKNLALVILATAQFMVVLDATIVNVALPSIAKALHFSNPADLQWVVTAYTLMFGGFLLLGGRLADLLGRRRMFLIGAIMFGLASMAGGLAPSAGWLIAFRALQGLSAALLSPAALSLVLTIFQEGQERNRALGVWGGVAAAGGALGLLLGGILTEYAGWEWVFFINVPIALFVVVMALRFVPESVRQSLESRKHFDLPGAILVTAGLMSLVFGLSKAPEYGWGDSRTISLFALAAALLIGFIVNEQRAEHPLMPFRVVRKRNVSIGNLIQLPVAASIFTMFFFLSLYLQVILHYTPLRAGLAYLPIPLTIAVTAAVVSRRVARIGFKPILIVGPLFLAAGLLYLSRVPISGNYFSHVMPALFLIAVGMGSSFVTLTLAATSGVGPRESGLVSGLLNTSQQLGGAIGLAVLTAIATSRTNHQLALGVNRAAASVAGFHSAFIVGACFAIIASLIALFGLEQHRAKQ